MALPVTPDLVEEVGALTPSLLRLADQTALDTFVNRYVARADAWMQAHMGGSYNLTAPAAYAVLQEEGQIYLTLERISGILKSMRVEGTHFPYMQEESAAFQRLIEENWGQLAIASLDLWVTPEVAANQAFAMPLFLVTDPVDPTTDNSITPFSTQLSEELDFVRGFSVPDVGTVRR